MSGICKASLALERRKGLRKEKVSKRENRKGAPENTSRYNACLIHQMQTPARESNEEGLDSHARLILLGKKQINHMDSHQVKEETGQEGGIQVQAIQSR